MTHTYTVQISAFPDGGVGANLLDQERQLITTLVARSMAELAGCLAATLITHDWEHAKVLHAGQPVPAPGWSPVEPNTTLA